MTGEYGFHVLDASRPLKRTAAALRRSIKRLVVEEPLTGAGQSLKAIPSSPINRVQMSADPAVAEGQLPKSELREKKSA